MKKKESNSGRRLLALLMFMLTALAGSFSAPSTATCNCPVPTSVTKTSQTSSSVSFAWQEGGSGVTYKAWYTRAEDGVEGPQVNATGNTVSFAGLQPGTYTFHVLATCSGGTTSSIIWDDLIIQ